MATLSREITRKLKAHCASRYLQKIIAEYYPHLQRASLPRIVARLSPARRSPDCRSVRWFGKSYHFTPAQAAIVAILWNAWENGTPRVGAGVLLHAADMVSDRVSELFKRSDAWGTMIRTDTIGHYWLSED
jgi:hypothetical protein